MVWCPEQLLQCVLAHIHYMPDHWKGNANKSETRDEMAQLFQYKAVGEAMHLSRLLIGATTYSRSHVCRMSDAPCPSSSRRSLSWKSF